MSNLKVPMDAVDWTRNSDAYLYRVEKANGRLIGCGTIKGSWFSKREAIEIREANPGSRIIVTDGDRVFCEAMF